MWKYILVVICFIGFIIVGFYIFGYEPTNLILNNGEYSFNKDMNLLNQTGKTDPEALVYINGIPAVVDDDGNFYGMVGINNGLNIINVTAKAPFKSITSNIATVKRTETPHHIDVYYQINNTIQKT
ncbi:hypothetical protein Metbo_0870 [Methanobacterium lacus]|uniref:Uncharacterized protein n=1 Tax=Methanobacterium lacus (strain AL-21) TaxID=877455 RepID=F0TBP2_METLA|nr:hypothetical protein Metbo_0870 [Methanobacterium lacus]